MTVNDTMYRLDPLPPNLPAVGDDDYQKLLDGGELDKPSWVPRPDGDFQDGTRHINRHCKTCLGKGTFKFWGDPSREEVVTYQCRCLDQWTLRAVLLAAGIPSGLHTLGVTDAYIPTDTADVVASWINFVESHADRGGGLILVGGSGTGKTFVASLIMRAFLAQGHTAYLSDVRNIIDALTDGFRDDEKRVRFHQKIKNVDLLVIDGLGRLGEGRSEFVVGAFNDLIHYRQGELKPTILVSTEGIDYLVQRYGGISSILRSMTVHHIQRDSYWDDRGRDLRQEADDLGLRRPVVLG